MVTGPSGSGKSTLLHAIAGLLSLSSGIIVWGATEVSALPEAQRDRWRLATVGYIFQDFQLIAELSPAANVYLPATFSANRISRHRAESLLAEFGVPPSRARTVQLSRGEQQRVAFARALLHDPPLILADEPTASLDRVNAERVIVKFRNLARAGKTIIVASHDPALLAAADRTLRIVHGVLEDVPAP